MKLCASQLCLDVPTTYSTAEVAFSQAFLPCRLVASVSFFWGIAQAGEPVSSAESIDGAVSGSI